MQSKIITMKSTLQMRRILLLWLVLPVFFVNGCSMRQTIGRQQHRLYEQQLEEQNRELSLEMEELQKKLLRKQGEINQLVLSRQHVTQEVVRTKAKLRSHRSKAETVANIAEVRAVIQSIAGKILTEQQQSSVHDAEQMIALSVDALEAEDIDGAFQLSNKAQQLVQPIRTVHVDKKNGLDVVFIVPQTMKAVGGCNVRMEPGMTKVLFTLENATEVKALAYVKKWIQIETEDNQKGWVYYQLLEIVQ